MYQLKKLNQWGWVTVSVFALVFWGGVLRGQDAGREIPPDAEMLETPPASNQTFAPPFAESPEAEAAPVENAPQRYTIPWGQGGVNLSAGLRLRYVDNVFLSNTGRKDDYVVEPKADVAAFLPIGRSNSVVVDVGLSYYEFLKNSSLNSDTPLINPKSELALHLETGDFTFRFSERFSYEENPIYQTGGTFFNVVDTGRLARFDNLAGVSMKWDMNNLVVDAGYHHENLWANGSEFNTIDHVSELVDADVMLKVSPLLTAGLETAGSVNTFDNDPALDSWRVRGGPGLRLNLTQFITARLGGGYERITYNSGTANALGIDAQNTFYAYAELRHQLTRFLSHQLEGGHNNTLGYNAGNLEAYYVRYGLAWQPTERLSVTPSGTLYWYREAFGTSSPVLYSERFKYVEAGVSANYQLGEHWQADVSWALHWKDSQTSGLSYYQNEAAIELVYGF